MTENTTEIVQHQSETTLALLMRAEIDQQIATAHAFPRNIKKFRDEALTLATLDEETARSCIYALPRGKGKDAKTVSGPSIRFAEILASCWGNLRVGSRIVKIGATHVTAQGICHDLERNQAQTAEIERRITTKEGRRFSDDMIGVTCNAAASIAKRNAVLSVIPKALWKQVYEAAQQTSLGNARTMSERRLRAFEYFSKLGVSTERILWALDKPSVDNVTMEDIEVLLGWVTALKEGDTRVEEIFPLTDPNAARPETGGASSLADKVRKAKEAQQQPTTPPAQTPPAEGGLSDAEKQKILDDEAADDAPSTPVMAPAPAEADVLARSEKLFVRMLGKRAAKATVAEMTEDDLHESKNHYLAAMSDPDATQAAKSYAMGAIALLEDEAARRVKG